MKEGKVLTFVNRKVNMKLVRIARGLWDVLVVLDARDCCQAKFRRKLQIVEITEEIRDG